jgi:amidase
MLDDLASLDAAAQAELVRTREIGARELIESAIARIERLNPAVNAVVSRSFERALERAERGVESGPFAGVPFLMKDLDAAVAGEPFHCGMRFLKERGYVADRDAHIAAKFRDAGFVSLGKTNTPELGLTVTTEPVSYGPTRNPWNTRRSAGGSSGGAAAAVASGMVPAAHASDGGGSIRVPASECGLVGLKPSRGRISLGPQYGEYWHGLVTSHVVTRSVRDTARILDCVHGAMPGDPYVAPPPARPYAGEIGAPCRGLRVGVMTAKPGGGMPHAECVRAAERAAEALAQAGHHVEASHPAALDEAPEATHHFTVIVSAWVAAALDEWSAAVGAAIAAADVEPTTWAWAEIGRALPAPAYLATTKWVSAWSRRMASWWDVEAGAGFDVLVTPTLGVPPPEIGELVPPPDDPMGAVDRVLGVIPYTPQFNMSGQPAISLPLHWSADGLPIGVQLVAAYGREDVLLRAAAQLEEILPWRDRHPPVFG